MPEFLSKVSDFLFSNFGDELDEVCVVLPNRRGGLFLKKHLASRYNGPGWSPSIYSIEDFIWEISGYKQADLAEQLLIKRNLLTRIANGLPRFSPISAKRTPAWPILKNYSATSAISARSKPGASGRLPSLIFKSSICISGKR
jgi:hypothetical protein